MGNDSEGQPVFLIGSGRSGTTLVQRLLNSYPDTMIWGEHAGFLAPVAEAYHTLADSPSMHEFSYATAAGPEVEDLAAFYRDPGRWQAWNNWFEPRDVDEFFRALLERALRPERIGEYRIWGFKEIRYGGDDRVIDMLLRLYPNARIVLIVRNGLNVLESQLTNFHGGQSRFTRIKRLLQLGVVRSRARQWAVQNAAFARLLERADPRITLLRYEEFTADTGPFAALVADLGRELGPEQLAVLEMSEGRGTPFKGDPGAENERWRRSGLIPLFAAQMLIGEVNARFGYRAPSRMLAFAAWLGARFGPLRDRA